MTLRIAKPEHEVAYQDLAALLGKHADKVDALEMLAIASNMVGKIVAMQDHRKITPEAAMKVVAANLELGNQHAMEQIQGASGARN